jgi:hypothetical protein
LDLVLGAPFSVTAAAIPEPGTWAAAGLLLLTAVYIRWPFARCSDAGRDSCGSLRVFSLPASLKGAIQTPSSRGPRLRPDKSTPPRAR